MKTPHAVDDSTIVKGASRREAEEAKQPSLLCSELVHGPYPLRTLNQLRFEPSFSEHWPFVLGFELVSLNPSLKLDRVCPEA